MPGPQIIEEQKMKERKNSEAKGEYIELKYITAIRIDYDFQPMIAEYGWLKVIWGYDIFFNGVPVLKTLVLADIIALVVILLLI